MRKSNAQPSAVKGVLVLVVLVFLIANPAGAALIKLDPNPDSWKEDRFDPHGFELINSYPNREVLRITVHESDGRGSRPSGLNTGFYDTQGRKQLVSGGAGSVLAADLYISSYAKDENNGSRRSGLWGSLVDASGNISAYTAINFTNKGNDARYRVWDGDIGWFNVAKEVTYDAWTEFMIRFTGTAFEYSINGEVVYTDLTIGGSAEFHEAFLQVQNFNGNADAVTSDHRGNYWMDWSIPVDATPTPVPVPAVLTLMLIGVAALGLIQRRRPPANQSLLLA